MIKENRKKLGLVFTKGVSLKEWVETGLFDREKQLYEEYLRRGMFSEIIWFTYGDKDEILRGKLVEDGALNAKITVCGCPRWAMHKFLRSVYSWCLHIVQHRKCKELSIVKSNQLGGAWSAYLIAKKNKIPFVLRTGYTYTLFIERGIKKWGQRANYKYYEMIEKWLYKKCDLAEVTSEHDKEYIVKKYHIKKENIKVLNNYINCDLFSFDLKSEKAYVRRENQRILFVGRLCEQKNLINLLDAISSVGMGIDIYGQGPYEQKLKQYVENKKIDAKFMGVRKNDEMPKIYSHYQYYILASFYEGMPKTLLEAMACGCICIGTEVEGIKECIVSGENGYLAKGTSAQCIEETIYEAVGANNIVIGKRAAEYIKGHYSLEYIASRERENIEKIMS